MKLLNVVMTCALLYFKKVQYNQLSCLYLNEKLHPFIEISSRHFFSFGGINNLTFQCTLFDNILFQRVLLSSNLTMPSTGFTILLWLIDLESSLLCSVIAGKMFACPCFNPTFFVCKGIPKSILGFLSCRFEDAFRSSSFWWSDSDDITRSVNIRRVQVTSK